MKHKLIDSMQEKYADYLQDESKLKGSADSISFPANVEEILTVVEQMNKSGTGITIQGGRSGIAGGCVPEGGHVMNMHRFNQILSAEENLDGTAQITVEAGITLLDMNQEIGRQFKKNSFFWPVQPSETTATVGGILASGAKGINEFHYGDSRQYVDSLSMVLADGSYRVVTGKEELGQMIGSEGIYGVITEATLHLLPKPESVWGISFFFENAEDAYCFCDTINKKGNVPDCTQAWIEAAEYLDSNSLRMIEKQKPYMSKIKNVPDIPDKFQSMVYVELAGEEESIEELAYIYMETAEEYGSNPDEAWAVTGEAEVEKMHHFRHAAAESVNVYIEQIKKTYPDITKLGTDMTLKDESFPTVMEMYLSDLKREKLNFCIFGHVHENHLHVNILPNSPKEYKKGKELLVTWAKQVKEKKGNVAAENGIGKLKRELNDFRFSEKEKKEILSRKRRLDPKYIWNRGNVF
ncbi:MAG: FAD-binding oxidoreductase [Hespellia sp.]|nr:FAD-binding oxidoreductase [Hespellia sp.]